MTSHAQEEIKAAARRIVEQRGNPVNFDLFSKDASAVASALLSSHAAGREVCDKADGSDVVRALEYWAAYKNISDEFAGDMRRAISEIRHLREASALIKKDILAVLDARTPRRPEDPSRCAFCLPASLRRGDSIWRESHYEECPEALYGRKALPEDWEKFRGPLLLEAGKFYATRSGRLLGPMRLRIGREDVELPWTDGYLCWAKNGRINNLDDGDLDDDDLVVPLPADAAAFKGGADG